MTLWYCAAMNRNRITHQLWTRCRDVAAALIAACWPGRDFAHVTTLIDKAPNSTRNVIVFGTLGALFAASIGAAQFGLIGLCLFGLLGIWLIR